MSNNIGMEAPKCCKCGRYKQVAHLHQLLDTLLDSGHMVDDSLYLFRCKDEVNCVRHQEILLVA